MMNSNGTNKSTIKVKILKQYLESEDQTTQLTKDDADNLIKLMAKTIAGHENRSKTMRQQIYTLDVLNGYDLLGYDSLNKCLKYYLKDKKRISTYYREAKAARVEANVSPSSPIGEIPESLLREVGKLKNLEDQLAAWAKGMATCKQGKKFPTATTMLDIVKTAYLNHAEISDSRVAKNWDLSEKEIMEKQMVRFKHHFKTQITKLDKKTKLKCWRVVLDTIRELDRELSMFQLTESVIGPGEKRVQSNCGIIQGVLPGSSYPPGMVSGRTI